LGDNYTESYFNKYNVNYQGILDSNNVTRVLSGYDVLILPSLREGYPGVIIEAMSAGLPVIATNLDAVKEMLDDNMDMAFLIVPNNIIELKKAIETFSDDNYLDMSVRSFMKFDNFDSEVRTKLFFKVLNL
jgi:glycosyltransferase involved in cell wall biosynthesis